jgi:hypothetical protein
MRTSELVDRFEKRIQELEKQRENDEELNITRDPSGKLIPETDPPNLDEGIVVSVDIAGARRRAELTVAELERHANALIPNGTTKRSVLADPELLTLWKIELNERGGAFHATLAQSEWHPDVTPNEVVGMLERLPNDPKAMFLAAMIRTGIWFLWSSPDGTARRYATVLNMDRELAGFPPSTFGIGKSTWDEVASGMGSTVDDETYPPDLHYLRDSGARSRVWLAVGAYLSGEHWDATSVSILAYLERKVRSAYKSLVRIPSTIAKAITSVRSGEYAPGTEPRICDGKTFPVPSSGFRHWRITPPKNTQTEMLIACNGDVEIPSPHDIRSFLNGSRIRTWWATWVLAFDREKMDGFFNWNPKRIILDLFGSPPETTTVKGKVYPRPNRKTERQIEQDFLFLESCVLFGVDNGDDRIEVANGEALIHRYGQVKRNGQAMSDVDLCAHARLAVNAINSKFVQIPMQAFRLHADYTPLAMGVANILRSHANDRRYAWLKSGALSMPLGEFAKEAGEDIVALRRHHHRRTWDYIRNKAERTIEPGGFGSVHFGHDADEATIVTIEPSDALAIAYRTLPEAQARKQAYDEEAAIREATNEKRGRGRPRRMPRRKGEG